CGWEVHDMSNFMDGGFWRIDGQRINGSRPLLAVSLAVAVNYLEGPFFDVQRFKGFRSVPSSVDSIRLVFLALSLRQNKPTRFPDKERVMLRCLLPGFILEGLLASDRHAKPDRLFSAPNESALAVPVLQRRDRPYWNFAERALN